VLTFDGDNSRLVPSFLVMTHDITAGGLLLWDWHVSVKFFPE